MSNNNIIKSSVGDISAQALESYYFHLNEVKRLKQILDVLGVEVDEQLETQNIENPTLNSDNFKISAASITSPPKTNDSLHNTDGLPTKDLRQKVLTILKDNPEFVSQHKITSLFGTKYNLRFNPVSRLSQLLNHMCEDKTLIMDGANCFKINLASESRVDGVKLNPIQGSVADKVIRSKKVQQLMNPKRKGRPSSPEVQEMRNKIFDIISNTMNSTVNYITSKLAMDKKYVSMPLNTLHFKIRDNIYVLVADGMIKPAEKKLGKNICYNLNN